jgi:hypothetical protein
MCLDEMELQWGAGAISTTRAHPHAILALQLLRLLHPLRRRHHQT